MILKIENLTFGWQQETLFENISGHLNQKEVVQLSGENGSGKTTLLQIISGMIPHFSRGQILSGEVLINGRSILKVPPKSFFPAIAFIPSINLDFFLLTESLAQEILITKSILKIKDKLVQKRLKEFSDFFPNIVRFIDAPFKTLQFNQKIVALAFIFYLQNAQLYLFDEVIAGFSESAIQRWYSFFEWLGSNGCTILFVDHHQQAQGFSHWLLKDKNLVKL
jgi:ABC-type branched-subunit amino acid transport system ATPase component